MNRKMADIDELIGSLKSCCQMIGAGSEKNYDQVTGRVMAFARDRKNRLVFINSWNKAIGFNPATIDDYKIIIIDCQDRNGNAWCHLYNIPELKIISNTEFKDPFCWIDE